MCLCYTTRPLCHAVRCAGVRLATYSLARVDSVRALMARLATLPEAFEMARVTGLTLGQVGSAFGALVRGRVALTVTAWGAVGMLWRSMQGWRSLHACTCTCEWMRVSWLRTRTLCMHACR